MTEHEQPTTQGRRNEPVALYEGPRLQNFRGFRLVALIAAAVGVGAALHAGAEQLWQRETADMHVTVRLLPPAPTPSTAPTTAHITWPLTLPGPAGTTVTLSGTAIVNVWLQGCADCMAAFEAMKLLEARGGFDGVRVYNVAYGSADPAWAATYGVDKNLAFDEGSHVVQPLGIGTFTTLVVDDAGQVRSQGSPVAPDFQARVLSVWRELQPRAPTPTVAAQIRQQETLGFLRGRADELRACGLLGQQRASLSITALPRGTLTASAMPEVAATEMPPTLASRCAARVVTGWQLESEATVLSLDVVVDFNHGLVAGAGAAGGSEAGEGGAGCDISAPRGQVE
jgi:thiol-disulfide isomerase/thioredoxin